jgi:hypothetical protein
VTETELLTLRRPIVALATLIRCEHNAIAACTFGSKKSTGERANNNCQRPLAATGILGRRDWDADGLRDIVRDYVIEHLVDDDAVLVIDETGFSSRARRRAEWRGNILVPQARSRTARSESSLPTRRVAGDTVYGVGDIEQQLRRAGKGYVLGVSSAHVFYFIPGASGDPPPARPRTSPGRGARPTGNACRQGPEPKDRGCMIGATRIGRSRGPRRRQSRSLDTRPADPSSYRRW